MRSHFKPSYARIWGILITLLVVFLFIYSRPQTVIITHPLTLLDVAGCPVTESDFMHRCCPNPDRTVDFVNFNLMSAPSFSTILRHHPNVCGGSWKPTTCHALQNIAVLIPYRNRELHLRILLHRLHSMLQFQQVAYSIYVIEQAGDTEFNRGLLMNIGIRESLRQDPSIDCFVFHDVDMLPENSDNLYMCDTNLRHLSAGIDEFRFHVPFANYAGGVTALSKANALKINGFPNRYWGWGNEDDELAARAFLHGLKLSRPPGHIGRYHTVRHVKASRGSGHYGSFRGFRGFQNDGLSSLTDASYTVLEDESLTNRSRNVALPFELNQCALKRISDRLGVNILPSRRHSALTSTLTATERLSIDKLARILLYTHIKVNVTAIHATAAKPAIETQESLLWFLRFYGWL